MDRIRVAYFIDHLKVGGAQRHLVQVLRGIDRRKFVPQVWTLKWGGELIPAATSSAVPVHNFGLGKRLGEPASVPLFLEAIRHLRKEPVHVVHCYLSLANVVGSLIARLAKVPVVLVSKRSLDSYPSRVEAWSQRIANRLADRVVANAEAVKRFVVETEHCPGKKIVVIPNGIDGNLPVGTPREAMRAKFGFGAEDRVVGTVGRLAWKKGYQYFLEAAARVVREDPRVTFVLVGDGPLRPSLEEQARSLGISSKVRFLGQRLDALELISFFDVFALSSVIEGMPNALLEAMALARPVVVTDAGGNAELVQDGQTGRVVPSRDSNAMARAMLDLLQGNGSAQRLGEAARQAVVRRFSFKDTLHAMEALYEELLAAKGVV